MSNLIDKLGEQKGITIVRKEVHEPKIAEKEGAKNQNLFTTFAEVELISDSLMLVFDITFNLLPSHIEILEPRSVELKNFDLSSIVSNLATKIHRYDELAKISMLEKNILINRLKEAEEKISNMERGIKTKRSKRKNSKKR